MHIIADLEWIDLSKNNRIVTQYAAMRVDEQWNVLDEIEQLVRVKKASRYSKSHIALNGYLPERFTQAPEWENCLERLRCWLQPEDVVLVWHLSSKAVLEEEWEKHYNEPFPYRIIEIRHRLYAFAKLYDAATGGVYSIAKQLGLTASSPEHCSKNDVHTLYGVMQHLCPSVQLLLDPFYLPVRSAALQRIHNESIINKCGFQYIYSPTSKVFHRCDCKTALIMRELRGCVYYKNAVESRRPCKLCKPLPQPVPDKPAIPPAVDQDAMRYVMLITGDYTWVRQKQLVACCNYRGHPGKLTPQLMKQHDCLNKGCHYFQKFVESEFWVEYEMDQRMKALKAQKKAQKKQQAQAAAERLDRYQQYAAELEYSMQIVRVDMEQSRMCKIFYVSDNAFADGHCFPLLLQRLQNTDPGIRIVLRHIRDVDGRFVTTQQYRLLKRVGCTVH